MNVAGGAMTVASSVAINAADTVAVGGAVVASSASAAAGATGNLIKSAGRAAKEGADRAYITAGALQRQATATLRALPVEDLSDLSVDMETPEGEWFAPQDGWPKELLKPSKQFMLMSGWKTPPEHLTPTAAEAPGLYEGAPAVGELRLEVLAAERLPKMDPGPLGSADPYALILFESNAARTNACRGTRSPRWAAGKSARAFCLPVLCSYSCVYVAIKDSDDLSADDDIGRVVIELGSLYSRTVYDCWLPLQLKNIKHPGRRGAVRLRYSVTFFNDRARLLAYMLPMQAPTFYIPFKTRALMKQSRFALRGKDPDAKYNLNVIRAHASELKHAIDDAKAEATRFVIDLLFWHDAHAAFISLACGLWWQLLITWPHFLPASVPLAVLAALADNYVHRRRAPFLIQTKPSFYRLAALLLLPGSARPSPLEASCAVRSEDEPRRRNLDSSEWWNAATKHKRKGFLSRSPKEEGPENSEPSERSERGHERTSDVDDVGSGGGAASSSSSDGEDDQGGAARRDDYEPLQTMLDNLKQEVAEEYDELPDVDDLAAPKGRTRFNPLAALLGPVQRLLGQLVLPVRTVRRALYWQDRIITTWLVFALLILALILALIPWAVVVPWTLRALGVALFGPHMYVVGQRYEKQQQEANRKEREYRDADEAGRKAILAEHRARFVAEQEKQLAASNAKRSATDQARMKLLQEAKHVLSVASARSSSHLKYRPLADPYRSTARPLRKLPAMCSPSPRPPSPPPTVDFYGHNKSD